MTLRLGGAASIVCAPLIDGPRQPLSVAHRSSVALQLVDRSGRAAVCLTAPGAVRLPHTVVVSSLPVGSPSICAGAGTLEWPGVVLRVARWWTPARVRLPGLSARVDAGAARRLAAGWRTRLGGGEGLTPYADDVLCGALVTLVASGHPVAAGLADAVRATDLEARTTATSASLLRHAADGWCLDGLAAYLRARAGGQAAAVGPAEADLSKVGHTSGTGLLEGVCAMIGPFRSGRRRAAA